MLRAARLRLTALEWVTRPHHPDTVKALAQRWQELPEAIRTDAQLLGRRTAGCEGTHGVFPRCDLACTPCYHSRDANRVPIDADHTVGAIAGQMKLLRALRGPGQHAQLIGGEVTLLGPEAHARALQTMVDHDRKPMSMSHGDIDEDYLDRLLADASGQRRWRSVAFAVHVDSLMRGRRAVPRPASEAELDPERARLAEMFRRAGRRHGVSMRLAHNMTVTPANLGEVARVTRSASRLGYRMLSFQPAAYVGNPARWRERFEDVTIDSVWDEIERGLGTRLPWRALQMGDERCNRSAYGLLVGERWLPLVDDRNAADLRTRDVFMQAFGSMDFDRPRAHAAGAVARVVARRPSVAAHALGWAARFVRRAGPLALLRHRARPLTLVVHAFMNAREVAPAWELMQRGEIAQDPKVREAQQRLQACSYAMAHPETGELVPACVQHSVLDPRENLRLIDELNPRPLPGVTK